jgi:hypothetical protein
MSITNRSARQKGSTFEAVIADGLAWILKDDRIERRTKHGNKDRGDIAGLRSPHGARIVVECKNVSRLNLGGWIEEARIEAGHDDAPIAIVIHKRRGKTKPEDQYVTMTLKDFVRFGWDADPDTVDVVDL